METGNFIASNIPMVSGGGVGTSEKQQMPLCVFQHLNILGEERLLAEFAWKAHVWVKKLAFSQLPRWSGPASPCVLVGHLALKSQERGSGVSSMS